MSALTEFICSPLCAATLPPYFPSMLTVPNSLAAQPVMRVCVCVCASVCLCVCGTNKFMSCYLLKLDFWQLLVVRSLCLLYLLLLLLFFLVSCESKRKREKREKEMARCTTQLTHLFPLLSLQRVILFHDLSGTARGTFVFLLGSLKVPTRPSPLCPLCLLAISVN